MIIENNVLLEANEEDLINGILVIPGDVEIIGEQSCRLKNLKAVVFPPSVRIIEDSAFDGCEQLETLTLPYNIEAMYEYAFANCSNLKEIWISENVPILDYDMFFNCPQLGEIHWKGKTYTYADLRDYGEI